MKNVVVLLGLALSLCSVQCFLGLGPILGPGGILPDPTGGLINTVDNLLGDSPLAPLLKDVLGIDVISTLIGSLIQLPRVLLETDSIMQLVRTTFKTVINLFPPTIPTTPFKDIADEYDFVIVGSGPSGSVVAARLSEVPEFKVLLIEAGRSENFISSIPLFAPLMQWTPYNWDYKMEKQPNMCRAMNDGTCNWPRGRALGGTSVINYMIYTRGNKEDFNRMERAGNTGWGWDSILKYYKKAEKQQLIPELIDEEYHGNDGYLTTEHLWHSEMTDALVEAGNGDKIPRDYNGKEQIVFSRMQGMLNKGRRNSAARSYLVPAMKRPNLHVLTEALATKVIFDDDNTAIGVEFLYNNVPYEVRARKEVILSAGSFNSPQLLMLSGVGPRDQLEKFNIPVRIDHPRIGQNMSDHICFLGVTLKFDKKYEEFFSFLDPIVLSKWLILGEGPITSLGGVTGIGYMKTDAATYNESIPDMEFILATIGSLASDFGWINKEQFAISDQFYRDNLSEDDQGSCLPIPMLIQPKSQGHLELQSADPRDYVKLYGNNWADPRDKKAFIASIRKIIELSKTEPLKSMGARLSKTRVKDCLKYGDLTDEYFSCALEYLTTTLHHQTGTCRMGPPSDPEAVVGPDLKVYNTQNLRVIDTSIIPESIAAHTTAPAYVVGEKGADLIKEAHGIPISI